MAEWTIRNLEETPWRRLAGIGRATRPDHDGLAKPIGFAVRYLEEGEVLAVYHREDDQEDFLVLHGSGTLVVEGEERPLRAWDFFHCPPGVAHAIVGGPITLVAIGFRGHEIAAGTGWGEYPVDPVAQQHGAGVDEWTDDPDVAYARFGNDVETVEYDGWLR